MQKNVLELRQFVDYPGAECIGAFSEIYRKTMRYDKTMKYDLAGNPGCSIMFYSDPTPTTEQAIAVWKGKTAQGSVSQAAEVFFWR